MKLLDVQHPFFKPLWRRVAIVIFCFAWAMIEFASGTPFWGVLFGAIGVYCGWQFFVVFESKHDRKEEHKDEWQE